MLCGDGRVSTRFDRVLLGRQTKGVPTHWMEHVEALRLFKALERIASGVTLWVPDMQTCTRRVGKHVKHVESWFIFEVYGFVGVIVGPECLPFGLDTGKVVLLGRISHFEKNDGFRSLLGRPSMSEG